MSLSISLLMALPISLSIIIYYHLFSSNYHLLSSNYHLSSSNYHLLSSHYHLLSSNYHLLSSIIIYYHLLPIGGWPTLWKIWKSIGMTFLNIWKNRSHVPNHQPDYINKYFLIKLNTSSWRALDRAAGPSRLHLPPQPRRVSSTRRRPTSVPMSRRNNGVHYK